VRELDGVDGAFRTNNIGNMGDGCSRGSTKVKDLLSRSNVNMVNTTEDTSSNLGSERVPDTVFNFGAISSFDRNSLFAIDSFAGNKVLGDEQIFLTTSNKDTFVSMGLDNNLSASLGSTTASASSTTSTSASTRCSTATTTGTTYYIDSLDRFSTT
jgi:hypothetical protein